MKQTVTLDEATENLRAMVDGVARTRSEFVIEQGGEPVAVLLSPLDYEQLVRVRSDNWDHVLKLLGDNDDLSEDEVTELALEAVREARSERRSIAT